MLVNVSCRFFISGLKWGAVPVLWIKQTLLFVCLRCSKNFIQSTIMQRYNWGTDWSSCCFLITHFLCRTGLIDYNFHCFKKAIEEVFDVRLQVQRNRKLLSQRRWSRQTVPNGSQLHPHWRAVESCPVCCRDSEVKDSRRLDCSLVLKGHLLLYRNPECQYTPHCVFKALHCWT